MMAQIFGKLKSTFTGAPTSTDKVKDKVSTPRWESQAGSELPDNPKPPPATTPLLEQDVKNFAKILQDKKLHPNLDHFSKLTSAIEKMDPKDTHAKEMQQAFLNSVLLVKPEPVQDKSSPALWSIPSEKVFSDEIIGDLSSKGLYAYSLAAGETKKTNGAASTNPPDSEELFKVLSQNYKSRPHARGMSGLVCALATILHLSVSRPHEAASKASETSRYFDLFPLYGNESVAGKPSIRDRDHNGRPTPFLKPDCYAEDRIEFLFPSVSVLLILFNRNHNYIAHRLAAIKDLLDRTPNKNMSLDEAIFQHARHINCVIFKDIILQDFLKGLMNKEFLSPGLQFGLTDTSPTSPSQEAMKSMCPADLAILYQIPSLLCERDIEWLQTQDWTEMGKDLTDVRKARRGEPPSSHFPAYTKTLIKRTDNKFEDEDLAEVLISAICSKAGSAGSESVNGKLMHWFTTSLDHCRALKMCTFNEFREYLGLEPYQDFTKWNDALTGYPQAGGINSLELLPGLLGEKATDNSVFGLGVTQTFALIRVITTTISCDPQFSPANFNKETLGFDLSHLYHTVGNNGSVLSALILRNLPRCFSPASICALFPLAEPEKVKEVLNPKPEILSLLDPTQCPLSPPLQVKTWDGIRLVLNDPSFKTPYAPALKAIAGEYGFMLGFDNCDNSGKLNLHDADQQMLMYALMPDARTFRTYSNYFRDGVKKLILRSQDLASKSTSPSNNDSHSLDLAYDIINPLCTYWVLQTLCGEDVEEPGFSGNEIDITKLADYLKDFASLYTFVFRRCETADYGAMKSIAESTGKKIRLAIQERVARVLLPPKPVEPEGTWELIKDVFRDMSPYKLFQKGFSTWVKMLTKLIKGLVWYHIHQIYHQLTDEGAPLQPLSYTFLELIARTNATANILPTDAGSQTSGSAQEILGEKLDIEKIVDEVADHLVEDIGTTNLSSDNGSGATNLQMEEIERLLERPLHKLTIARLTANIMGLCVVLAVNYAAVCIQVIDFYMCGSHRDDKTAMEDDRKDIENIVKLKRPENNGKLKDWINELEKDITQPFGPFIKKNGETQTQIPTKLRDFLLMGYIREAQRLGPPLNLVRSVAKTDNLPTVEQIAQLKEGNLVVACLGDLHQNALYFEEPSKVNPARQIYLLHGTGPCMKWGCTPDEQSKKCQTQGHDPENCKKDEPSLCPLYTQINCTSKSTAATHTGSSTSLDECSFHASQCDTGEVGLCKKHAHLPCSFARNTSSSCTVHGGGNDQLICKTHGFRPWSIQGLGVHKCPGLSFCDNTLPEIMKVIFSLEDLKLESGIQPFNPYATQCHPSHPTDPVLYTDSEGNITPYPASLKVSFKPLPKQESPEKERKLNKLWRLADLMLGGLLATALGYWGLSNPAGGTGNELGSSNATSPGGVSSKQPLNPHQINITCKPPVTIFRRWEINTVLPDAYGQPAPIEYTLERSTPHRLTLLDVDQKDTQLGVFVDGRDIGKTSDFTVDKNLWCYPMSPEGRDRCIAQGFSHGSFVVPAGKHSVRVVWVGKEYHPHTQMLDWGTERTRRLMWQFENCS